MHEAATGPTPRSSTARLLANAEASPDTRTLTVALPAPWTFEPGQVVELAAGPGTAGYFAIASAPSEAGAGPDEVRLDFLIKAGGSDSEPLMHLAPGASLTVRGPFGRGFSLPPPAARHPLLFVTAGTALSAVRSAVIEALARGHDPSAIALVIGVREASDLGFVRDIAAWVLRGVRVRVAVSHGPLLGEPTPARVRGRVQAHLGDLITPATRAFIAGSEALEDDVSAALVAAGMPVARIQRNYRPDQRAERSPHADDEERPRQESNL
jgi:anaerobic sulfite reductase subunit B